MKWRRMLLNKSQLPPCRAVGHKFYQLKKVNARLHSSTLKLRTQTNKVFSNSDLEFSPSCLLWQVLLSRQGCSQRWRAASMGEGDKPATQGTLTQAIVRETQVVTAQKLIEDHNMYAFHEGQYAIMKCDWHARFFWNCIQYWVLSYGCKIEPFLLQLLICFHHSMHNIRNTFNHFRNAFPQKFSAIFFLEQRLPINSDKQTSAPWPSSPNHLDQLRPPCHPQLSGKGVWIVRTSCGLRVVQNTLTASPERIWKHNYLRQRSSSENPASLQRCRGMWIVCVLPYSVTVVCA